MSTDNRNSGSGKIWFGLDGFGIATVLILAANLLFGASHISMLPPWEGFDEIAHFSSIQQIADTGTIPRQKISAISVDVEGYAQFGPMPYSTNPPMEKNRGFTYKSFFEQAEEKISETQKWIHGKPDQPRSFTEGIEKNWQSQHPPLLYSLLAPVYHASKDWSWGKQLWLLRMSCYLFVWVAMVVGIACCKKICQGDRTHLLRWCVAGIILWPLVFHSWFPSMARLGNDSLCTLIAALVWWWVLKTEKARPKLVHAVGLGLLLGLGCLTKAFFVPISFGMVLFWSYRLWLLEGKQLKNIVFFHAGAIIASIGVVSGWWYIQNWMNYGVLLGSLEMIQLRDAGGLGTKFFSNFSFAEWLRGHVVFVRTLAWVGTWSWARPENWWLLPVSITPLLIAWYSISKLREFPSDSVFWTPVWWLVPVLFGFSYHVVVRVVSDGIGTGTSGYFLNMLVVPLGTLVGLGLIRIWQSRLMKFAFLGLTGYGLVLAVYTSWAQTMLFSGILFKQGETRTYLFPETLPPVFGMGQAIDRLQVISYPNLSLSLWLLAVILTVPGLMILVRKLDDSISVRLANQN